MNWIKLAPRSNYTTTTQIFPLIILSHILIRQLERQNYEIKLSVDKQSSYYRPSTCNKEREIKNKTENDRKQDRKRSFNYR